MTDSDAQRLAVLDRPCPPFVRFHSQRIRAPRRKTNNHKAIAAGNAQGDS